jgi:hypothetical protein
VSWLRRTQQAHQPRLISATTVTAFGDTELEIEDDARKQARAFFPEGADFALRVGWKAKWSYNNVRGKYVAQITAERWL